MLDTATLGMNNIMFSGSYCKGPALSCAVRGGGK